MKTTIDKAGRVVIPAQVRNRLRLAAGTPLRIVEEGDSLRLVRDVARPELVRVRGRLVARPRVARKDLPSIDVGRLIEEERDRWPG